MRLKWPGKNKLRQSPPQYEKEFASKLAEWGQMRKNLKEHPDLIYAYFARLYELTRSLEKDSPFVYRRQIRRIARLILWDRAILWAATSSIDLKFWFVTFVEPLLKILEKSYHSDPDVDETAKRYRSKLRMFWSAK